MCRCSDTTLIIVAFRTTGTTVRTFPGAGDRKRRWGRIWRRRRGGRCGGGMSSSMIISSMIISSMSISTSTSSTSTCGMILLICG